MIRLLRRLLSTGGMEGVLPLAATTATPTPPPQPAPAQKRMYIEFTCKVCKTRSGHHMSHQAYHHGTVLIECGGCQNRHLIADRLGIVEPGFSLPVSDVRDANIKKDT
jgi:hypothetical protein